MLQFPTLAYILYSSMADSESEYPKEPCQNVTPCTVMTVDIVDDNENNDKTTLKQKFSNDNLPNGCIKHSIEDLASGITDTNSPIPNSKTSDQEPDSDVNLTYAKSDKDRVQEHPELYKSQSNDSPTITNVGPIENEHSDSQNQGTSIHIVQTSMKNCDINTTNLAPDFKKTGPSKDEENGIHYVVYESEQQMPHIMRLITKDLSEPYSIYTYRYFIHNWPKLCFLVSIELTRY